jgi:hypothetical protein
MASKKKTPAKATPRPTLRASIVHGDLLAEVIWTPSAAFPTQYAVYQRSRMTIQPTLKIDGQTFAPPKDPNRLIEKNVVLLASDAIPYGSNVDLFKCLTDFIHRYCDVPEFWEKLIATYAMMTWIYDRFTALPYLRFLGEPSTGKSRDLMVAGYLCYKGIMAGGAITSSPIFRLMDVYRGTFIMDEADFKDSDQWVEIVKILNCGYMFGLSVLRSAKSGDDYEPRAFDAFGPKIIANRSRFADPALETRCITLETQERKLRDDIPRQLPPEFFEEARELRGKLLQWRFNNYNRISTDESKLRHLDPRLTQIGTPLYAVAEDQEFREQLLNYMGNSGQEIKSESYQALVLESIKRLTKDGNRELAVKDVAAECNWVSMEDEENLTISPKKAGGLLRSLGFDLERKNRGYFFTVNSERLREMCERYGVNL